MPTHEQAGSQPLSNGTSSNHPEHHQQQQQQKNKKKQLRFLVIGAGSRGNAYARAVTTATDAVIHAVAEPHAFKRREFGRNYIWGEGEPSEGQEFTGWKEWLRWELDRRERLTSNNHNEGKEEELTETRDIGVDGVFVCTLDDTHAEILQAIAPLQLHVLCEKPLATSLADCLSIYRALLPSTSSKIFSIGHVLRYSPHNVELRKLLLVDRVIGDIVSLEHCEPVGWWHFAHSYVRGNWRRQTPNGDGSLLTKSCHDIDFILWLLCSPADPSSSSASSSSNPCHEPRSIMSTGRLTQFRRSRKPAAAGNATNCLSCPAERECNYSAVRIYRDMHLAKGETEWPVNIVCPDIEDTLRASGGHAAAEAQLLHRLGEDYDRSSTSDAEIAARPWYGRCVYESDNDVCDDQVVIITWDDDDDPGPDPLSNNNNSNRRTAKTATFHMIAPTEKQCERRGRIYGTLGELSYDSRTIRIYDFGTQSSTAIEIPRPPPEEEKAHGGGDYGLTRGFVGAVDAVENGGWEAREAQARFVGCTLEEAVRSHAVVFAAEEARRGEKIIRWREWWAGKVAAVA